MWTNEKGGRNMKTNDIEKEVKRKIENVMQDVDIEYDKKNTKIIHRNVCRMPLWILLPVTDCLAL